MDGSTRVRAPDGPPRRGGRILVFTSGDGLAGRRVALAAALTLGRDEACELVLPGDDVSRRHARVEPDGDGHRVVDLGSTNGTFVNGAAVSAARLAPGDRLRIGPHTARYLAEGDEEERELAGLVALGREDPLTGLPNRRALAEALRAEHARAARSGAPLAALALDLDHFKRVNDVHGHAAGDAALRAVCARARAALREGDLLARVGGEELVALLPGADLAAAVEVAERIRAAVAAAPVQAGEAALALTVSIGCAALAPGEDAEALLARADACGYEAKRRGRDRVAS